MGDPPRAVAAVAVLIGHDRATADDADGAGQDIPLPAADDTSDLCGLTADGTVFGVSAVSVSLGRSRWSPAT